jgi:DNA-directed RNA polymerase specialized sigma24 family protein
MSSARQSPAPDLDAHLPGIRAGDAQGFAAWLAGAESPLRAALRSFAAVVDVEAVLQEAFLRVWQLAPDFVPDGRPNALLRYAHRIARHLCHLRAAPPPRRDLARRGRRRRARRSARRVPPIRCCAGHRRVSRAAARQAGRGARAAPGHRRVTSPTRRSRRGWA